MSCVVDGQGLLSILFRAGLDGWNYTVRTGRVCTVADSEVYGRLTTVETVLDGIVDGCTVYRISYIRIVLE